ncbi:LuxR C-terminal-related transcriptional regulator [Sporolactobacillus laevolacticus]|uniref:LuxR C-terminal-related transcriptional regulator n=1 Tax=Sporolactobacillus laevolacticus TaxID=33018 RepID=UPI0025B50F61|nr:LuxR C-terminal-related transcriptional regulator [Sporolactobacillus laevolacticus]MDN3956302.1 LuxR C-terminal-related transcriptional regulator [Sporolactobacillus laevolacticus]
MPLPGQNINASLTTSILVTKCNIPKMKTETLLRPRLATLLDQGIQKKLTFVSAPAGYGKSTLLAEWALRLELRPGWLSLEQADNNLVRFWRYMIVSIDVQNFGFEKRTRPYLNMLYPTDFEQGLNMILNELQKIDQTLVLILDDFHFLIEESVISSFSYFIEHMPEHVHLFVASRTEPPFHSARLQAIQVMQHIHAKDLSFTNEEGADFYLRCMKLNLDQNVTTDLVKRTEGWVTALKLAGLALQYPDQTLKNVLHFSGDFRLLEQYLLEEVFHLQGEAVQNFLMNIAILKRMNTALCNELTGSDDAQEMIDYLNHAQLFLTPLDEKNGWYRFHHLFSEFLQHRLNRTNPQKIISQYLKAGEWCEKQHFQEEALEYYITGEHFGSALRLLGNMTTKMLRMEWSLLKSWLSKIPRAMLLERPSLYFSYALSLLYGDKKYILVEKMLSEAEKQFDRLAGSWTTEEKNNFWGSFYFVKAYFSAEALHNMNLVVQNMKRSRQFNPSGPKLVFAQKNTGTPSMVKDHFAPPEGQLHRSLLTPFYQNIVATVDDLDLGSPARVGLSEFLYEWDDLDEAESTLNVVFESTDFNNPVASEALVPAWLLHSNIKKAQGLLVEAKQILLQAKRNCMVLGVPSALIYFDAELVDLALKQGNMKPADEWIKRYSLSINDELSVARLFEYLFLLRILIMKNCFEEAWTLSERLRTVSYNGKRVFYWTEVMILQSLLLQKTGKTEFALEKLRTVLNRTEPEEFIRIFVDEGKSMAELLSLYVRLPKGIQTGGAPSLNYIRSLLSRFKNKTGEFAEDQASVLVNPLTDLLTKQESNVLQLIVRGMTNKEIAEKLNISYGTVKTHINNVYSKLDVHSRLTAIRKGKELGL